MELTGNLSSRLPRKAVHQVLSCQSHSTTIPHLREFLGEAAGAARCQAVEEPGAGETGLRGGELEPRRKTPATSLQCPPLTKPNVKPAGKGKIFKQPISTFAEQRANLKLRDNKLKTDTVKVFWWHLSQFLSENCTPILDSHFWWVYNLFFSQRLTISFHCFLVFTEESPVGLFFVFFFSWLF